MAFTNIRKKIAQYQTFDINKEAMQIIREEHEFLEDLLKRQLAAGKDKNNNNVTINGKDFYSKFTIEIKKEYGFGIGKITDWITNNMTGEFYASIQMKTDKTKFTFDSDVPYYPDIIKRSGSVIMDLNKEHLIMFRNNVLVPELKARIALRTR